MIKNQALLSLFHKIFILWHDLKIFLLLLLDVGWLPNRVAPLDYSIHPFRNNAAASTSSFWSSLSLERLHPFAHRCSPAGFSGIHFLWGEIGVLIGLFTHGLAIKKLLVTFLLSVQCNHFAREIRSLLHSAERLKSFISWILFSSNCCMGWREATDKSLPRPLRHISPAVVSILSYLKKL